MKQLVDIDANIKDGLKLLKKIEKNKYEFRCNLFDFTVIRDKDKFYVLSVKGAMKFVSHVNIISPILTEYMRKEYIREMRKRILKRILK